ncbi:MAG: sterol desaturase family protein [Bdellovibrio sp.]|nr:sterol desaturase family protein [Bdellovibrio sp.]
MIETHPFSITLRVALLIGMLVVCLWFEYRRPLRQMTRPKFFRIAVNLGIAAVGAIVLRLFFFPIVFLISNWTAHTHFGIFPLLKLSSEVEIIASLLALDYTLYLWHWMNHKIPFLWRFHNVHHVDLDLDVSTASRFHFGELIFSTGFRSGQIVLFGINPFMLILFETLITTAAQFHHSNIRLPFPFEKILNKILVTPRMHGIHHSIVQIETDSNFSTIFPFWDHLHRSIRLNIPQSEITIGVAAYRDPKELGLFRTLLLPFSTPRDWKLPDGSTPERTSSPRSQDIPPGQLLA